MNRYLVLPLLIVISTVLVVRGKDPEPNKVGTFMRQRLVAAGEVLEGLALEDYEKIATNAQKMSLLSLDSTWQVVQTDEYAQQSTEFRRAAMALTKAANKKNLDDVTLRWVDVTMKCVQCHKYVRDERLPDDTKP